MVRFTCLATWKINVKIVETKCFSVFQVSPGFTVWRELPIQIETPQIRATRRYKIFFYLPSLHRCYVLRNSGRDGYCSYHLFVWTYDQFQHNLNIQMNLKQKHNCQLSCLLHFLTFNRLLFVQPIKIIN